MTLSSVFIFLFGLVAGSFLNAVIWRMYFKVAVWHGRSMCPACRHSLSWQDLIPIISFFLLRARCRYCAAPISWQYPLVELVTGVLFLAIFNSQFSILNEFSIWQLFKLFYLWTIASALIIIFVYDLRYYIISDTVVYPAIALTFLYRIFEVWSLNHLDLIGNWKLEIGNFESLIYSIGAGILASAFFFAIYACSKGKWMGFGDVKLALLMGLALGFPNIIAALFFAFVIGAAISLFLVFFRKKQWKSEVPFAPFLVLGTFLALFFGARIVNWYLNMFL